MLLLLEGRVGPTENTTIPNSLEFLLMAIEITADNSYLT